MRSKLALVGCLIAALCLLASCSGGVSQSEYDSAVAAQEELQAQLDDLQKDYDALKSEYDEYKEKMKPFEEMTAAQAEAEKAKAEQEKAKAEKEEKERKAAEKAEKKKKEAEEKAAREAEEAQGYETGITYDQLARTPDDYTGKKVKFYGKVIQVMEGDDEVTIRLAVDGNYDTVLLGAYDSSIVSSRVLEDDFITIYGVSGGLYSYESTMGAKITIPSVLIAKIDQ